MPLDLPECNRLCQRAAEAMGAAYAPYSNYHVGAALFTSDGKMHTGCNVENASFGLTMCAERVAIGQAVSQGMKKIVAIAVATRDGGSPCGACRQVLAEFADGNLEILLADSDGKLLERLTLDELLPHRFNLTDDE